MMYKEIVIHHTGKELKGDLNLCQEIKAWIVFAHGSGSSRKSKRNTWVARELNKQGFATLLFDLLTPEEDTIYANRFDIPILAERLNAATEWLIHSPFYAGEKIGYFGASTGAAAALVAAAQADVAWPLYAIVSRGGRPDLAPKRQLNDVTVPTLLIVGSHDEQVIPLNEYASTQLIDSKLVLVPGASHLFEEAGTLEEVIQLSINWFNLQLNKSQQRIEKDNYKSDYQI